MTIYFLVVYSDILNRKFPPKSCFAQRWFNLCSGAPVKPCQSGLRTGWVTHREDRLKGPYVVLSFLLLLFAYYVVLLLTVYWKADLALFLRPDLEKEKIKEQIWPGAVCPKIIIVRAIIHSWNFADFDLFIGGETDKLRNLGFRQCKTIIMPLIPISYSPLSLVVGVAFAVLSDVPSAPRFLVDVFFFVVQAEFEVGILQRIFISQTTDSHFVNYRFSFRKLQMFISFRSISFRSISFRKLQ